MKTKFLLLFAMILMWQNAFANGGSIQVPSGQWLYFITYSYDFHAEVTYFNNNPGYPYNWQHAPSGDLIIPSTITYNFCTYTVTEINHDAFRDCETLTSVTIPNTVTKIGDRAFQNCSLLTSVTIPTSVTSIGKGAFLFCTSLTSVTIPNTVTSISNNTFRGCTALTSISIPNSVAAIGDSAFRSCTNLTSVTIPNSVSSIGQAAFAYCSSLTSVTLPNTIPYISQQMFFMCGSLTSVTIPNSVTTIGLGSFYGCSSLTSVTIPKFVESIYGHAFAACNGLTTVAFNADSCTIAGSFNLYTDWDYVFPTGRGITTFTFGNNVKVIPDYLCYGLSGLTSVSIPDSVTSIGDFAFQNCSSLDTIIMLPVIAPVAGSNCFYNNSTSRIFLIPCGSYNSYSNGNGWGSYLSFLQEHISYTITVGVNNTTYGSATNTPVTCAGQTIISAIANNHYHFDHWSNGSAANPDTIILTHNLTVTAYFAPDQYTVTGVPSDSARGSVSGTATVDYLGTITLTANANTGYHFVRWNDNNTQNPRTITVTGNATYTAYFESNVPVNPATVTATISEITSTSAHAEIVKGQHTSYYYYLCGPESAFTQNGLTTDEAIISYVNQLYGQSDRSYDNTSGYMNGLTPSTDYLLVVVPYNSNNEVGTVCREQFTTLSSAGTATVTATISEIESTSAHADIVMGQNTSYFYYFYGPQSAITQNGLTTDEAIISYVNQNYGASERNYSNVSGYMNGLTPNTAYLLVVVPYNSNDEVGTITRKQFTTLNTNGIEDAGEETYAISCKDGRLTVSGAEGEMVSVYSIDGRRVYSSRATGTTVIDVPTSGVYLVKVGDTHARKVVVTR